MDARRAETLGSVHNSADRSEAAVTLMRRFHNPIQAMNQRSKSSAPTCAIRLSRAL